MPEHIPKTVAILARDAVAGQALELLLESSGYNTRLIAETINGQWPQAIDGVGLLVLTPTLSAKSRERFLNSLRSTPATAKIPVLEMITSLEGAQAVREGQVLWPCRIEDLKAKIEAALRNGSLPEQP